MGSAEHWTPVSGDLLMISQVLITHMPISPVFFSVVVMNDALRFVESGDEAVGFYSVFRFAHFFSICLGYTRK